VPVVGDLRRRHLSSSTGRTTLVELDAERDGFMDLSEVTAFHGHRCGELRRRYPVTRFGGKPSPTRWPTPRAHALGLTNLHGARPP
jgi:hypothetical protein